jgi:acetylornithine aminotransferase
MGGVLIAPQFRPVYGQLGTTFGGNHLACAAALAVLDIMEDEQLVRNAADVGAYLMERLQSLAGHDKRITEVRGRGLMIGIEFSEPVKPLRERLIYEQHCFTGASGSNMLRLLPPLCLTRAQADDFIGRLSQLL